MFLRVVNARLDASTGWNVVGVGGFIPAAQFFRSLERRRFPTTRIYGSGLISSHADPANALGPNCEQRPFELDAVLGQSFAIDHVQPMLFMVEAFDQLFEAVEMLQRQR